MHYNIVIKAHLGDNVFAMILFYNIKQYIEENNITIALLCRTEYHNQLHEFICSPNITLHDYYHIQFHSIPNQFSLWMNDHYNLYHQLYQDTDHCLDAILCGIYNHVLKQMNIPRTLGKMEYTDLDLIHRYNNLPDDCKDIQVLVVNSLPLSGQYNVDDIAWNNYINELGSRYKIITTRKVENIPCTLDFGLTVKGIAALSTKCKIIMGVNTGVIPGLLNTHTLENVNKIYICDENLGYGHPKFESISTICNIDIDNLLASHLL